MIPQTVINQLYTYEEQLFKLIKKMERHPDDNVLKLEYEKWVDKHISLLQYAFSLMKEDEYY